MQNPIRRRKSSAHGTMLIGGMIASLLMTSGCQHTANDRAPLSGSEQAEPALNTPASTDQTDEASSEYVTSADRNYATSLLMQWWDLFEAPPGANRSFLIDEIFSEDVVLHMAAGDLEGRDAVRAALSAIPETNGRSHHLRSVTLTHLDSNLYSLEATFQYHIAQLDGSVEAGESAYHHKVLKSADGTFRLVEIKAEVLTPLENIDFVPSYEVNRARGALAYYLGTTDTLKDDYPALSHVLSPDSEIHGMFDPAEQTFNTRGDGVLRGIAEISPWLASRQTSFTQVAHTIGAMEMQSVAGDRVHVLAQIETEAWPKTGEKIKVSLPIQIEMIETGGTFMQIARIDR